jgi:DNA-binding SARP family transcriptional activator
VEFRILGPLEAADGARAVELTGGKQKALLAVLLLHADRVVPVERLVDDLWGADVPDSARKMIQIFVSQLRKQLPPGLIETRAPGYRSVLDRHSLDLHRFEALYAWGREARGAGHVHEAAESLREALDLWRGPPLAEFEEPFARQEEARLVELHLTCLEERIDVDLTLARHADLVGELEVLVRRHPLRERLRAQQMLALYRCGRHAEALEAFQRFRRALRDELGIEPSARLKDLERLVLRQDASLDLADGPLPPVQPADAVAPAPADVPLPESRRIATVLVADAPPPDAPDDAEARRALADDHLRQVARVLERHGARVAELGGTRLLAAFGVPVAQDDDALRAVTAAVALRATAQTARIGIATGEVVTGDPLVAGVPVDEAVRLQEAAEPAEILATRRTWRPLRHAVTAEQREGAWLIESVEADAAPLVRRLETPLVGRDDEIRELLESFDRIAAGQRPHLLTVFGAPGVGKTRLAIESAERLRARATTLVAHCRAGGKDATYAPLRDVLAAVAEGDPLEWLRGRLGRDDEVHLADQLAAATGLAPGTAQAEDVALATRRLLAGHARRRPLLLVLDDVHWAAPAFLDLVQSLVELSHAPMLVMCLARPDLLDVRPQWGGGRLSSSTIMLDALSRADADSLLDHLSSETGLGRAERENILALAEGNALFIEQLLAAALEDEVETLPDSIQALLAGRLDRLDSVDRAVVEAASVCGPSFAAGDVAALVGRDVAASLVTLVRRELIRPGEFDDPGGAEWSFRHALIRDVAYAGIPRRRRAVLHEALGARADEHGADADVFAAFHLDQALRELVESGAQGADVDRLMVEAAERLRRAGLAAHDRDDFDAASSLLARACELLPRTAPERLELLPKLGELQLWVGGVDEARALLDEAHALAVEVDDARLAARARITTALTLLWTDTPVPPERMLRDLDDAVPVLEQAADHEGLALAELLRFHALDQAGVPRAEERLPVAAAHARRAQARQIEQRVQGWVCITLPRGSVPVDAALDRVDEIRRSSPSAYLHASSVGAAGLLRAMRGEFDEARALVQRTARELAELGLNQATAAHSIALAEVEILAGDDAAAERLLMKGFQETNALGDKHSGANIAWRLGLVLARQGRSDEAERFARIAERAQPRGLWVEVWWRVVLALVEAHRGRTAAAAALVGDARARIAAVAAPESGMQADMLLESADALRAVGRHDEAAVLVAEASRIADRLGYVIATRRAEAAQRALTA